MPADWYERMQMQAEVLVPVVKAMEEALGREAAQGIVRRALHDPLREEIQRKGRDRGKDPRAAMRKHSERNAISNVLEVETITDSPAEHVFKVHRCAYAEYFREIGEPEIGYLMMCSMDDAVAEGWGIDLQRAGTLMQGAACCDFCYTFPPRP